MKEKYFKPQTTIDEFKTVDIMTASDTDDNDAPFPWG